MMEFKINIFPIVLVSFLTLILAKSTRAQESDPSVRYVTSVHGSYNGIQEQELLFCGSIIIDKRSFVLGVLLNKEDKISGFSFMHQYYLNKRIDGVDFTLKLYDVRPYLMYNFVYSNETSNSYETREENFREYNIDLSEFEEPGRVTTMEHYLGLGVEIDIFKHLFLDVFAGGGMYIGLNNDNNELMTAEAMKKEHGFTWILKTGLAYNFE
jgi:hypothetical protein